VATCWKDRKYKKMKARSLEQWIEWNFFNGATEFLITRHCSWPLFQNSCAHTSSRVEKSRRFDWKMRFRALLQFMIWPQKRKCWFDFRNHASRAEKLKKKIFKTLIPYLPSSHSNVGSLSYGPREIARPRRDYSAWSNLPPRLSFHDISGLYWLVIIKPIGSQARKCLN